MIIHVQFPQGQVTPEEQASSTKDSSKDVSCITAQTRSYVLEWGQGTDLNTELQSHGISAPLLMPRLSQSPHLPSDSTATLGHLGYTFLFPEQISTSPGWRTRFSSLA